MHMLVQLMHAGGGRNRVSPLPEACARRVKWIGYRGHSRFLAPLNWQALQLGRVRYPGLSRVTALDAP